MQSSYSTNMPACSPTRMRALEHRMRRRQRLSLLSKVKPRRNAPIVPEFVGSTAAVPGTATRWGPAFGRQNQPPVHPGPAQFISQIATQDNSQEPKTETTPSMSTPIATVDPEATIAAPPHLARSVSAFPTPMPLAPKEETRNVKRKADESKKEEEEKKEEPKTKKVRTKGPTPPGLRRWIEHLREFRANNKELVKGKSCSEVSKLARETYVPTSKLRAAKEESA